MTELNEHTLDNWLYRPQDFLDDFRQFTRESLKDINVRPEFDDEHLIAAHAQWNDNCDHWKRFKFRYEQEELSHIKVMALFLACFGRRPYFKILEKVPYCDDSEAIEAQRTDFMGAPEVISALDFAVEHLNALEAVRLKKANRFQDRLTLDVRHDLISYVSSEDMDKAAVILALKSLYARH